MTKENKKRALILSKGTIFSPEKNLSSGKQALLSSLLHCDLVHSVFRKELIDYQAANYSLIGIYIPGWAKNRKALFNLLFSLKLFYRILRRHYGGYQYHVIITRDPIAAGPLGVLLRWLTGAKLLVELNGNYASEEVWDEGRPTRMTRLKRAYAIRIIPWVLNRCSAVKLLYPQQLSPYRGVRGDLPVRVFHDFVPMSELKRSEVRDSYLMFLGYPWYLKGVDLLIEAFLSLADTYPELELRLAGGLSDQDRQTLQKLCRNHPRVKILGPLPYLEAIKAIGRCDLLILPSRTEAMGRTLLEAMGQGKPVIGAQVDGIPHYIQDQVTGLLFEKGNARQLAEQIDRLLADPDAYARYAKHAYQHAHQAYSEEAYMADFKALIRCVLEPQTPSGDN